ncbi:phospholipase C type enzyme [Ceratobasidium sp. 370]|nr:phospholipase C type enzyme [Ceratobasidium sp. 370]
MSDNMELTRSGSVDVVSSVLNATETTEPMGMDPSRDPRDTEIRVLTLNCCGALGAGLVIFSRFPIISTTLHPYSLCGSPLDVGGGDWFVGKAVVSALIEHPLLGEVEIFNTHKFDDHARKWLGKRLDYILFRPPAPSPSRSYGHELRCRDSVVTFTHHVPGTNFSFSDHFGVAATFDIVPCVAPNGLSENRPISPPRGTSYSPATRRDVLESAISTMGIAHVAARHDSYRKLLYFVGLLVLLIGLIIGSAWNTERGINPLLIFLAAVITWGGTTLLYAGFLGGGWETRALMQVMEELELLQEAEGRRY